MNGLDSDVYMALQNIVSRAGNGRRPERVAVPEEPDWLRDAPHPADWLSSGKPRLAPIGGPVQGGAGGGDGAPKADSRFTVPRNHETVNHECEAVADSRFTVLRNRETVNHECEAVRIWELPEPPPRRWLVPRFIPEGALSIWYGDAGVFKSYLACYLAITLCTGKHFIGLETQRSNILYVDTELDQDEFVRRAYAVARGLGLERPPIGLHYTRPQKSLADDETIVILDAMRRDIGAALVIVDSLSLGAYGVNLNDSDVVTRMLSGLKALGTVLAVDHIPKPMPGVNMSNYRPFGSQFKWAESRCITQVLRAESGDGIVLRPAKSNFGRLGEPVGVKVSFVGATVSFEPTDVAALGDVGEHLPKLEQVYLALSQHEDGATPATLASELGMAEGTVRNWLTILRKQGRADATDGVWRARGSRIHDSWFLRTVNRECEDEGDL